MTFTSTNSVLFLYISYHLILIFSAQFILNYTEGSLQRHVRSSEGESPSACDPALGSVCIVEVTSHTYHKVVMDNTKVWHIKISNL